jgi:hypothetical protein
MRLIQRQTASSDHSAAIPATRLRSPGYLVSWITARIPPSIYDRVMPYVTQVDLVELEPNLRAMATVEESDEVRAALNRLADRYSAMAAGTQKTARASVRELSA